MKFINSSKTHILLKGFLILTISLVLLHKNIATIDAKYTRESTLTSYKTYSTQMKSSDGFDNLIYVTDSQEYYEGNGHENEYKHGHGYGRGKYITSEDILKFIILITPLVGILIYAAIVKFNNLNKLQNDNA